MHDKWERTYRLRPYFRNVGIVCTAFFLCAWVGSVLAAYFNTDGSFARPALAVAFFTVGWGGFTLLGVWLILAYAKDRLFLNHTTIRHVGVLSSTSIPLDTVQELKWRLFPQGGSCVLISLGAKVKIAFGNYTEAERTDLIMYLRGRICEECQTDWDTFYDRVLVHSPERVRQQRSAKRGLILALFGFAIIFAVLWLWGHGSRFLVISLVNVLVGAWATLRYRQTKGTTRQSYPPESSDGPNASGEPSLPSQ